MFLVATHPVSAVSGPPLTLTLSWYLRFPVGVRLSAPAGHETRTGTESPAVFVSSWLLRTRLAVGAFAVGFVVSPQR